MVKRESCGFFDLNGTSWFVRGKERARQLIRGSLAFAPFAVCFSARLSQIPSTPF